MLETGVQRLQDDAVHGQARGNRVIPPVFPTICPCSPRHRGVLRLLVTGLALLAVAGHAPGRAADDERIPLFPGCELAFASVEEGAAILGAEDEFILRTSPFDRQARLRTDRPVSREEHRAFAARCVLPWSPEERGRVAEAVAGLGARLAALEVPLPPRIMLVKTSGDEEGGAAYTRGTAVMLPTAVVGAGDERLRRLVRHELFHVASRHAPALRTSLYAAIGFRPCGDVVLPADLEPRRITNPDAPLFDHAIRVRCDGVERDMVPVLYSRVANYDAAAGRPFFATMEFRLMAVETPDGRPAVPLPAADGRPLLRSPQEVGGFFEQTGRNTGYLIHPEEIVADNVALLLGAAGGKPPASPDVLERIERLLPRSGESRKKSL